LEDELQARLPENGEGLTQFLHEARDRTNNLIYSRTREDFWLKWMSPNEGLTHTKLQITPYSQQRNTTKGSRC